MTDPAALRALAVEIAEEAGALLLEGLSRRRTTVLSKSSSTDMVTEMDHAAEALIVERLRARRPADAIVGEEGADDTGTTGVTWVIDPLDGTTNYLYRLPAFAVSIAAEADGEALAGAVYNPVLREMFSASLGDGATLNDETLRIGDPPPLATALVATGFGYDPERRAAQARAVAHLIGQIRDIRRFGSAALDLCSVAAGRADVYFEEGTQRWDHAAGALVASEAGARVVASTEMTVAAHPALFDEFEALLLRCRRSAG